MTFLHAAEKNLSNISPFVPHTELAKTLSYFSYVILKTGVNKRRASHEHSGIANGEQTVRTEAVRYHSLYRRLAVIVLDIGLHK